jgi:hypothetical protein
MSTHMCLDCDGDGACRACHGSGSTSGGMLVGGSDSFEHGSSCPSCNGTGECPKCDGAGEVEVGGEG